MTMTIAPGVKLDPNVLASNVPLRRTGTEEVRSLTPGGNAHHLCDLWQMLIKHLHC